MLNGPGVVAAYVADVTSILLTLYADGFFRQHGGMLVGAVECDGTQMQVFSAVPKPLASRTSLGADISTVSKKRLSGPLVLGK